MNAFLVLVCALAQQQSAPSKSQPIVTLSGADGHFAKASIRVVRNTDEWRAWWAEMRGVRPDRLGPNDPPTVDFQYYMVVAVAQGPSMNSAGISFGDVVHDSGTTTVHFDDKSFQSMERGVPCNAWGAAVIGQVRPNQLYPVVHLAVEENVQGLIGHEPVWKKRAEFTFGK